MTALGRPNCNLSWRKTNSKTKRRGWPLRSCAELLLHQFDPPVFGTTVLVVVGCNGRQHADSRGSEPRRGDPVCCRQVLHDRGGPPLRQPDVVVEGADVIGVPDDEELQCGILFQQLGDLLERRLRWFALRPVDSW